MAVKISFVVTDPAWRQLRDMAEEARASKGRASVSAVVGKIIERELTARCAADKENRKGDVR